MAKVVPSFFLDNGLSADTTINQVILCAGQPTSYADAAAGARPLLTATISNPTLGAGSPDGRQANYPALSATVITQSGTADHVCYRDTVNSRYIVTTCPSVAVVANGSNTASIAAVTRVIRDAT